MTHRLAFGAALMASLGLHLVGLSLDSSSDETQIEAGSGVADVAVGNSFADLAVGTLKAMEVTDPEPVLTPQPEMVQPTPVTNEFTAKLTAQSDIDHEPQEHTEATSAKGTLLTQSEPLTHMSPNVAAAMKQMAATSAVFSTKQGSAAASGLSIETLTYADAPTFAPTVSKRPALRPASLVMPKAKQKPKATSAATRGKAQENAKAGAQAKTSKSTASRQGTNSTAPNAQGNAAATNYPGQVMRKINRVPKPRVSANGPARVRFTISRNGGLAGLSLTRSSGSSLFDKAALRVIQRAAPFPKPPPGAQRSFSLTIKGR